MPSPTTMLRPTIALAALTQCRFKPAQQDGKPVESWQAVQYVWSLN